jgi:hypothetical protein
MDIEKINDQHSSYMCKKDNALDLFISYFVNYL